MRRGGHGRGGTGLADPRGQGQDSGRPDPGRFGIRARRPSAPLGQALRDRRGGGNRHPGETLFPPGMGWLHGQILQGLHLPRFRHHHAQAGKQAHHLSAGRAHLGRQQHRHFGARSVDLRVVRPAPAGHRAGRPHSILHDRLGRGDHPGQETQPHRGRLAAQFPGRHPGLQPGHAPGHRGKPGCGHLQHGRYHLVPGHPGQSQNRYPQPHPRRGRPDLSTFRADDRRRKAMDRLQYPVRGRHGHRRDGSLRLRAGFSPSRIPHRPGGPAGFLLRQRY